jgi:hypothetical protein
VAGHTAPELQRKRTYGSGLSPVGFQLDSLPSHRTQPFFSSDDGLLYFMDRVLSPQGSRWMYTVDFGTGINVFRKERQAVTSAIGTSIFRISTQATTIPVPMRIPSMSPSLASAPRATASLVVRMKDS